MRGPLSILTSLAQRHGTPRLLRIAVYPVTLLFTMPVRLAASLAAARVLADGRWGDYPHFAARPAINSLFYWTRALNLYRHGRSGVGPVLGLGDYPLSRCFNYSLPSLYAYWIAGAVTVLAGMLGWWFFHLLWLYEQSSLWVAVIMALALISVLFYANLFRLQNYNVLGWAFFPVGLYGLLTGHWLLAAAGWLAVSFGSFTAVVVASALSVASSVAIGEWWPLLSVVPAALKLATHFWPFWVHGKTAATLSSVAKAIGLRRSATKYKRRSRSRLYITYFLLVWGQFAGVHFAVSGAVNSVLVMVLGLFLVNMLVFRFADDQSLQMLVLSVFTAVAIQDASLWITISYWVAVSPIPRFANSGGLDVVAHVAPFRVSPVVQGMRRFLEPVPSGCRVLMAFDDPGDAYDDLFDGYRVLIEVPLYIAAKREVHILPDFWAVFSLNYPGAPDFWGRDVPDVSRQVAAWRADFVILYAGSGEPPDERWAAAGYETVNRFDWRAHLPRTEVELLNGLPAPVWWLLKVPERSGLAVV